MSSPITFERRVISGLDDVEQRASGSMVMSSGDLNMADDTGSSSGVGQTIGIRFTAVDIPQGATITAAYLQFQVDEVGSAATSLLIRGEDADDAAAFASVSNNVSSRATTDAAAAWTPAAWTTVGEAGLAQRTADLSAVVQEIVARGGWQAGNDMAFVITGSGTRTAEAFEGGAARAPLLHIEYVLESGTTDPVVGNISINDVTITEGNSGPTTATFTVTRTGGTAAFAVDYATADGTANAGSDYVATSNTLSFAAGETTKTVSVTINGDSTVEGNETFFLNLTNASNGGSIVDAQGLGTITNDDGASVVGNISVSDAAIAEGSSGTKTATFTVSRTGTAAFTVAFATADGTANAGSDYIATSGTLSFAAGESTKTVAVTINGDTAVEDNETFSLNLTNASNGGTFVDAQGFGTITNDDGAPGTFEKRVASGLDDVEQRASGKMVMSSSDLELVDDGSDVGQSVGLRFTGIDIPQGATITKAYLQFYADEVGSAATSLQIRGQNADDAAAFTTVSNDVSSRPTTSAYADWTPAAWTTVGESGLAQRTPDLSAIVQEIVARPTWQPGTNTDMAFVITGSGTRTAEAFESKAAKAALLHIEYVLAGGTADPVVGGIAINDVTITEGNSGTKTATFSVSRTGTAAFTVDFATANGTATAGSDYVGTSGTLSFAAGESTKTVSVTINGDTTVEGNETFFVNLTNASNGGTFGDAQAVGTITNDEGSVAKVRFAAFGDFDDTRGTQAVANLVNSKKVDFIITTGDNVQQSGTQLDDSAGKYYSPYIGNYSGAHGSGSAINRFFPSIGDSDYSFLGDINKYFDFFTLPGNERYYDFQMGPIHFFALNANSQEPDGRSKSSVQAQWLKSALQASDSPYNIVYFHHSPYSSSGGKTDMQWPFEEWGATTVMSSHRHNYERIHRDDNGDGDVLPYFVVGTGGFSLKSFDSPVEGSQVRYNKDFGALIVEATDSSMTFEFWSIANGGTLIDSYTLLV